MACTQQMFTIYSQSTVLLTINKDLISLNLYSTSSPLGNTQVPKSETLENVAKRSSKQIMYRIYSCISRPFTTKKPTQKIPLDLYTSRKQRPDQAVQEINITIARSAFTTPVLIVVEFLSFRHILLQQKSVK